MLAVQGPHARAKLRDGVAGGGGGAAVRRCRRSGEWIVAGTGYTGEDGVEIHVAAASAPGAVGRAGRRRHRARRASARATRCGSRPGCRCTATSSGPGITPLQARLGWVVRWDKGEFRGRDALEREKEAGPRRLLDGLAFAGRQPGREGAVVSRGKEVGVVTSGNFSPTLGHAIAFAFLRPDLEPGAEVEVDVRGKPLPATVVKTPFVAR